MDLGGADVRRGNQVEITLRVRMRGCLPSGKVAQEIGPDRNWSGDGGRHAGADQARIPGSLTDIHTRLIRTECASHPIQTRLSTRKSGAISTPGESTCKPFVFGHPLWVVCSRRSRLRLHPQLQPIPACQGAGPPGRPSMASPCTNPSPRCRSAPSSRTAIRAPTTLTQTKPRTRALNTPTAR